MNFYILKHGYISRSFHKTLLVMKLMMLFLTTAILQVSASSFAQRITLNDKNTPLEKVIDQIHQQSGYDFVYNNNDLKEAKSVTIHLDNVDLQRSIFLCLEGQDLDFEIKDKTIILKKKEESILGKIADIITPTGLITGTVIDADGYGLPGATIQSKDKKNIAVTNANGEFTVNVDEGTILVFSYIGYQTKEVTVTKGTKRLVVTLDKALSKLDEVIVEGYRKGSERLSTGNISSVSSEELDKQPVQDPLQALQGRMPGVVINQQNGVPGSRLTVEIRGRSNFDNTLTSEQPLFILDGVPLAAGNDKVNLQGGPYGALTTSGMSALAGINMADIESIAVLKDADATAIYGSRGANGVVLITTKKGKAGKMVIGANVYSGISTVTTLTPMLNTQQYIAMRNEAFSNDGLTKTNANAADLLIYDNSRYTDFEKLLVGNNASTTDAELTVSGGTKLTQYRVGGGYHHETTVWPGDKSANRASLSFSMNTMSEDEKFTMSLTGNYASATSNLNSIDLATVVTLPPNYRIYDANGNLAWNEGNYYDGKDNPMAQLNQLYNSTMGNLNADMVLNYKLLKNVVIRSSMGYNSTVNDEKKTTPISTQNPLKPNISGALGLGDFQLKDWIVEPQAEYNGVISKGKLNVLAGATYNQRNTTSLITNATGFTSDDLINSLKGTTAATTTTANAVTQYNYEAFFGRINYNWQGKYIANFTGRRDGSSRFGPNNRFSNFAAVGLAWIFTNEELLKQNKILSYGKLRASYGSTGNDQIGDYTYLDTWSSGNTYNDSITLAATKLYNPNLHWERNDKSEIGLELGFLKDRILLSVVGYRNIISDPLVTYALPRTTGFANIVENLDGVQIQNIGLELQLSTKNIDARNFKWSTDFNFSLPKNSLKAFPNLALSSYATKYAIGQPLNRIYDAQYTGVNPTTGLYTVKDVNGDGVISSADYVTNGSTDPKFYGGFNNTVSYKRISLSFFFQFVNQLGHDWRTSELLSPAGTAFNVPTLALSRWQNPGDVTDVQKFTTSAGSITGTSGWYANYFSNHLYTDASFIRLKNVYLSYAVPEKWLNAVHISSFKLYLSGQNLFLITPYKGADPETQSYTVMPPLRTLTAGLQLTL